LTLTVTVPANTSAEVVIPAASTEAVREGNVAAVSAPGVSGAAFKDDMVTLFLGSGHYEFAVHRQTTVKQ